MRIALRLVAATAVGAVLLASATAASAGGGLGPPPPAIDSQAYVLDGGAAPYSGSGPPVHGSIAASFLKGSESYQSDGTTTVVDFTLPPGVTVRSDSSCANQDGLGDNYCLQILEQDCGADPTAITVDGNTVSFQIACSPGGDFGWFASVDSTITTPGEYSMSVQFKVHSYQRTTGNMWQINPAQDNFTVGGG